ncbi:MAG: acetyl-CoA C-acetyltransferase [Nevskiaceae bacterium]|nr:MAG: acetyl-CoA C-acetyltransferase [Nevskiaceae bacterium]TBR71383.1 MAG: acetyl-CoA C-acetyltransferase [Nevskiaceae bacterium]
MAEAYIVDALRTPTGKRRGSLAHVHAADLGALAIRTLVERNGIPADDYDDVIYGCVDAVGPMAGNIARTCALVAGLPLHVPGVAIDRQCGSSQQAVHFAAQAVMSGTQDVIVAGGVQTMSSVPIGSAMVAGKALGFDDPFHGSKGWVERFGMEPVTQFHGAQMIADKWRISRHEMEVFALESHRRALQAQAEGRFDRELVEAFGLKQDETVRHTTLEQMESLKTLEPDGTITAAVASQTGDAASAMLVVSERALKRYDLKPRARIHTLTVCGDDPVYMLTAPIPATRMALKKSGLKLEDIDRVEINEAFVPVVLAWFKEIGYPWEKTNVNGGAVALAHPLGATGTKLMTTLLCELERSGGRYGLQTMCEGGGLANATIIERL